MTLSASAFAKPMKIRARLFLFDKPIKCFEFLFTFYFYFYFSRSYKSRSILLLVHCYKQVTWERRRKGTRKLVLLRELLNPKDIFLFTVIMSLIN